MLPPEHAVVPVGRREHSRASWVALTTQVQETEYGITVRVLGHRFGVRLDTAAAIDWVVKYLPSSRETTPATLGEALQGRRDGLIDGCRVHRASREDWDALLASQPRVWPGGYFVAEPFWWPEDVTATMLRFGASKNTNRAAILASSLVGVPGDEAAAKIARRLDDQWGDQDHAGLVLVQDQGGRPVPSPAWGLSPYIPRPSLPETVNTRVAAAYLGVQPGTLRGYAARGVLPRESGPPPHYLRAALVNHAKQQKSVGRPFARRPQEN